MRYDLVQAIYDPNELAAWQTKIRQWISDDLEINRKYWAEWNEVETRLNSTDVPAGWSKTYSTNFATRNDVLVSPQDKESAKDYVVVNRTRPNHESTLGDFLAQRRKFALTGRTPHDRARAAVLKQIVQYYEEVLLLPETVYFPSMDGAWSKGLHWTKASFNPYGSSLSKMIDMRAVSCRDVLIDNGATGPFFMGARRLTHISKMDVETAKKMFLHFPLFNPDQLSSDNTYDLAYQHNADRRSWGDWATFYDVEFHQIEPSFYRVTPDGQGLEEIPEELYRELMKQPEVSKGVFRGPDEDCFYIAHYNDSVGLFAIEKNPYGMFTLIPWVNMETEGRLYPLGDVAVYSNLADLLNVLVTAFLENVKRTNIPIAKVNGKMWREFQTQIETALKHGGPAPGIEDVFNTQPINTHLVNLIPEVVGWIQDSVSKHSASMGEMPAKQIAKETVSRLIARDRTAQGRKDLCVKYALTQVARIMVKMISSFYNEPDFLPLTDTGPGRADYIPLNQTWTEEEYLSQIASIYRLQPPQPPTSPGAAPASILAAQQQYEQAAVQFEQAFAKAREEFEAGNDIDIEQVPGYLVDGRMKVVPEQLQQLIAQSGMSVEEFTAKVPVEETIVPLYHINTLESDADLNVVYAIDSDYQNDPQYKSDRAMMLFQSGAMNGLDMLKEIGIPDAEGVWKRAQEGNQMLQMGKAVMENPQILQAVQMMMQGVNLIPAQAKTNGEAA